ncbi:hypothetical protein [Kitasatospora viridis]|uniref:Uncharacterized protein n=1 Tax=Kitasatospora viridis TaxID=281105 RepID=A0A561UH96_9ACTN|nr:hypothetical protein [Kitasatospora viridis]TWF98739.1 hypothetical protein FHX73_112561 [Kitasatospora viridis]
MTTTLAGTFLLVRQHEQARFTEPGRLVATDLPTSRSGALPDIT